MQHAFRTLSAKRWICKRNWWILSLAVLKLMPLLIHDRRASVRWQSQLLIFSMPKRKLRFAKMLWAVLMTCGSRQNAQVRKSQTHVPRYMLICLGPTVITCRICLTQFWALLQRHWLRKFKSQVWNINRKSRKSRSRLLLKKLKVRRSFRRAKNSSMTLRWPTTRTK